MTAIEEEQDNFRPEFKRYKSRATPVNLKDVVDVDGEGFNGTGQFQVWNIPNESSTAEWENLASSLGLQPPRSWRCYAADGFPGLRFIRDPFLQGWQRYWVKRCITEYPCKPNVTNLDAHRGEACVHSPWHASQQKLKSSGLSKGKTAMDQLRWVTLGYHYNWNDKVYHQHRHSPFPEDLSLVSEVIAAALGYRSFQSQAAIVNFYHMDSTLGGHTDHSEFDLSAPLFSYSLGQSAILLVGGETKATKPVAIHLRSGDIVILGGASRLAYHAVPRIMHAGPGGQLPECFNLPHAHQHEASRAHNSASQECNTASQECTASQVSSTTSQVNNTASQESNPTCQVCSPASQVHSMAGQVHCMVSQEINPTSQVCSTASQVVPLPFGWSMERVRRIIEYMNNTMSDMTGQDAWTPFEEYLKNARMNISVRQVTGPGKGFPDMLGSTDGSSDQLDETSNRKKTKIEDR